MKNIILVTGNKRKLGEARLACDKFDIKVVRKNVEIDEIQSHHPIKISKHKAQSAFQMLNKPLVVTDTSWNISSLKGFPGGYMKDVAQWFEQEDFLNLLKDKKDRRVSFTENIVYKDKSTLKVFSSEYWGIIVKKPKGTGNSIENLSEFDGVTLGERRQQGGYSHEPEDYIWFKFAKWFSKK